MEIVSFRDMFIAELQELVSVEEQLGGYLLRMAEMASNARLKDALTQHQRETQLQEERVRSILQKHGADPNAHTDQAMQELIGEAERMLVQLKGNELRDAGIVVSAQKLEHYEIAAYGTAAALAGQLDLRAEQKVLHRSLEEEKQMDVVLTKLAKGEVNRHALAA